MSRRANDKCSWALLIACFGKEYAADINKMKMSYFCIPRRNESSYVFARFKEKREILLDL